MYNLGSEGTSLSLLEAMAAKCAEIATNVGGMTNIILDNYNGLIINPDESELYLALEN
ncbi:glycosyltransferase [Neobacillus drentensis]|uniref:glycosyltransferase n=1 Tax=Neobacillus drentensis TaxID=220684 RepID=UPI003B587238